MALVQDVVAASTNVSSAVISQDLEAANAALAEAEKLKNEAEAKVATLMKKKTETA